MRRLALTIGTLLCTAAIAACGEDDAEPGVDRTIPLEPTAAFTLTDIGNALDGTDLEVVRDPQVGIAQEIEPRPVEASTYSTRLGPEFSVLLFEDAAAAQEAVSDVLDAPELSDGGSVTTAYNAVAVLPRRPDDGISRAVFRVFRQLRQAGAREVDLDRLVRDREQLLGTSVSVSGQVVQRLPNDAARPRAIGVRGPGGESVLVVPARGDRLDVPDGAEAVVVRGTLALVGRPGLGVASDGVLSYRKGDPVVVADSVAPA